jgi:aminoglycoside phosphotransferase (APT) family kinase protein
MQARQVDLSVLQSKLIGWLQEKMPQASNMSISGLVRAGAGVSNETFLFDLSGQENERPMSRGMVLRHPPRSFPIFPEYNLAKQYRIMECLQKTDVPVPRLYGLEENEKLLGVPFYLMGKIDGVVPPEFPLYHSSGVYYDATPQQRAKMWWGSLEAMTKVHLVDWKSLALSFLGIPGGGTDPIDQQLNYWEAYWDWVKEEPQPIMETAVRWLRQNTYVPKYVTLCWGDSRLPNTIYSLDDFSTLALLDWEMAFLGDPEADLAWFIYLDWHHSVGWGIPRLEGSPSAEETVDQYESLTGRKVENPLFNEVFAAFRFAAVLYRALKNLEKVGIQPGPEDAAVNNNPATQRLAELLELPPPGRPFTQRKGLEEMTVIAQFHFTGPQGRDVYLVVDKGKPTQYEGSADNPDVVLTISMGDWEAIKRGEMTRLQAIATGRMRIDGDTDVIRSLEDIIANI